MWHHRNTALTLRMSDIPRWFPSISRRRAFRLSAALFVLVREPIGLHARLEPGARGRVLPDLAERVKDASLDPRSRPAAPHGADEAGAAVGDDDVRRRDRLHRRRPRPRRLRARHAPRDDALIATAYQHDEVACGPDPVDEKDAVPLVVRDGHGPQPPEPGRPAPERPSLPGHVALGALGHEPTEELAQGGGVAVAADLPQTVFKASKRGYIPADTSV